jgi:ribonuclease G
MVRRMLLEANPYRVRVALKDDDRVTDLFVEHLDQHGVVGNIYRGRVTRVLPGMDAAFVDIGLTRDAYLYAGDLLVESTLDDEEGQELPAIDEVLHVGQEILVQVRRDAMPKKGARVNMELSLPGRFLVWMPQGSGVGISRRITDEEERNRLEQILADLGDASGGLIIRTAGKGRPLERLRADLDMLQAAWEEILERASTEAAPALLYREHDLAVRAVRDLFRSDVDELWVDGEATYERILKYLHRSAPAMVDRVRRAEVPGYLFDNMGVEREITRARKRRVWLPSGGHIVIQPTEALVSIDVNTGRYVGKEALEKTVLKTNLEAAEEIAHQLRLRDLGGLIVVDFIDMAEEASREQVFDLLESALERDHQRTRMLGFSEFGLIQITRRRARMDLGRLLTEVCPTCKGRGRIPEALSVCLQMRRDLLYGPVLSGSGRARVRLHPDTLAALESRHLAVKRELDEHFEGRLEWVAAPAIKRHEFLIEELA